MANPSEVRDIMQIDDESERMPGGLHGAPGFDEELQRKVALQQQLLELEKQGGFPPPTGDKLMSEELMQKVRQQQQMLEVEKIREQQQLLMEQQQRVLMEAAQKNQQAVASMSSAPHPPMMPPHVPAPNQLTPPLPHILPPAPPAPPPSSGAPVGVPPPQPVPAAAGPPEIPPQNLPPIPAMGIPQPPQGGPPPQQSGPVAPPPVQPAPQQPPPPRPTPPLPDMKPGPPQTPAAPVPKEIRLPQALEKVLEFKTVRAQEMGVSPEELDRMEKPSEDDKHNDDDEDEEFAGENFEDDEIERVIPDRESKNKRKKKKKKKARKIRMERSGQKTSDDKTQTDKDDKEDIHIEYVQEQLELDPTDPNYHTFTKIFETFKITEPEKPREVTRIEDRRELEPQRAEEVPIKARGLIQDDEEEDEEGIGEEEVPKLSKKKLKKQTRLSVAQLKQLVSRPDVVEMQDVTARDPRLLVHIKATRNSVPVPRHWSYKRKYLQGKRGIEKPPFDLPDFIKATGIMEMRAALAEKEDQKTLKAKMRERVRPKMGKIDIDYQKLHDAFFRYQTKPKMTIHGDLYYEGKEFETRLKEKKPGNLSDDLRIALGMPVGANCDKVPPPWLIAMQRYGPPPSYPNLKIPGLNAPIPESCSFGYHAGGWGKPPVDESGKPLYGDVFGTQGTDFQEPVEEEEIDKTLWGELESESESEEESEESEGEEDDTGLITPAEGLVTPSGMSSVPIGMETPEMIELRKRRIEDAMDQGGDTPALYTILPEKKTAVGGAMMGSAHVYDISAVTGKKVGDKLATEGVEVSLNPEELDLDTAAMQAKYEQTMREQQSQLEKEDLSDMVAEHAAKQKKRKKQQQDTGKSAKKYKEFKF